MCAAAQLPWAGIFGSTQTIQFITPALRVYGQIMWADFIFTYDGQNKIMNYETISFYVDLIANALIYTLHLVHLDGQ